MPITVENLSYCYGSGTPFETQALRNVSLSVADGEFIGIMGHTGCGKSTLLQLLAGLLVPSAGTVRIDGEDINRRGFDKSVLRRKLGIVFQYPECQLFETTVQKDVAFGLKHSGLAKAEIEERVRWALELCGFDYAKIRQKAPMALSGGEKRRLAIAGVLAVRPQYLLFDEPFAGLDPLGRDAFIRLTQELNRSGVTLLIVSHNAGCLSECAGRIVVLEEGEIAADGTPAEVFRDVERMKALQLGVSDSREIAWLLQKRGVDFPQEITAYSELLPAVLRMIGGESE